jgi:carbonic anhydrase/acetyltransferase-like protein (isoleucine patch superfamily)
MTHDYLGIRPTFDETNFIANSADVIGDVRLGAQASVWYQSVVRGDVNWIRLGARTNVQDGAVLHVTHGTAPLRLGDDVTVGHGVILHGCTIRDRVLIGMGALVMDHAVIGSDSIVGARALVTQRMEVPPRSLVLGSPARVVRALTDDEVASIRSYSENYVRYSRIALGIERPEKNPFYDGPPEEAA